MHASRMTGSVDGGGVDQGEQPESHESGSKARVPGEGLVGSEAEGLTSSVFPWGSELLVLSLH